MPIHSLQNSEIEALSELQPQDWGDIRIVFKTHYNQPYFNAFTYKESGQIIGVGEAIMLRDTAWIGNIIVHEAHRNRGIGKKITQFLVNGLKKRAFKSIFLLATEMGKPLYEKLNFESIDTYQFLKVSKGIKPQSKNKHIRKAKTTDIDAILALDAKAMGEDRSAIIKNYSQETYVFQKNKIDGFYIPNLGNGLVIANNFDVGKSLLQFRLNSKFDFVCIPTANDKLLDYLISKNYRPYRKAYLMKIGASKVWNPQMVYSRIGGNIG